MVSLFAFVVGAYEVLFRAETPAQYFYRAARIL